ncbi:MAG: hypothetical protein H6841_08610 [Planctomycetes bacterium]|nr:hypothetical protein [Planctomycetota bacterium]MCB9934821.1 hypothetical protein [Planctomycetota bacterium]
MLANSGWPGLYFAQGAILTAYVVPLSIALEATVLRLSSTKAARRNTDYTPISWGSCLLVVTAANAASMLFGVLCLAGSAIPTHEFGVETFVYYWPVTVAIEYFVVSLWKEFFSGWFALAVGLGNALTYVLMFVAPKLPLIGN